eukprot:TRINITY_DN641_c1_g2_i1.p1 TRINITY_DN641_c1_g2~~TRINITY_DN641_c1_g2_i1.p1  ORF type:complete len:265 (-),score=41.59 TRINITY_DN641_c1_g2_i1:296-1090(-)
MDSSSSIPIVVNVTSYSIGYYDVDGVVIASGINRLPIMPDKRKAHKRYLPGFENFQGISIHSSMYRRASAFSNLTVSSSSSSSSSSTSTTPKTVIVSGGGKSAQDIAADLRKNIPDLIVYQSASSVGQRNRILNISKEEDGSYTVYFVTTNAKKEFTEERYQPVKNVAAIIWCWGFGKVEIPINGTKNYNGGFYNEVLYKSYPGLARVGTQGVLATARPQATYVGRVLTGRIPVPDVTTPEWLMPSSWNGVGRDQYLWHELTSY